jgi:NAD(P)H dehydrogenase (quinone)
MRGVAALAITGSTGVLGGLVARRLAERGVPQRLVVRDCSRAPRLDGAEIAIASSYGDPDEMANALAGVETLYFVSGREDPDRLEQHRAVVGAAKAAGVTRIVYVSFVGAAANATFTLARQHWATEQAIRETGLAFTFLRSSVYLDFMPFFAGGEGVIRGPAGDGRFAPVSRDDLADAAVAMLVADGDQDGKSYDLTGPELMTLADVAARLSAHTGRPVTYEPETIDEAWASRRPLGAPDWEIEGWITSYLAIADGSLAVRTDAVERLIGHPAQTLEQCLSAHPELLA